MVEPEVLPRMGIVSLQVAPLAIAPPLKVKALELVPVIVPPQLEVPAPTPVVTRTTRPEVLKASVILVILTGSTLLVGGLVMSMKRLVVSPTDTVVLLLGTVAL